MHQLIDAAVELGVSVGAHPGFADRENFGRSNLHLSPLQLYDLVLYQLGAIDAFMRISGARLQHVKPHGAMYNMAAADVQMARSICNAIKDFDAHLIVYGLSGSKLIEAAVELELKSCSEVFADRIYLDDANLAPRNLKNAMITDTNQSLQQVLQMIKSGTVTTISGKQVPVLAQTICIHGDGPNALAFARNINQTLKENEIRLAYPA